ncbi:ABC transporter permease [Staphylothermus hellenicus]|uniref:Binding-protein-dependent transport systems inner membrane component n=1 Tax=Staphylothermus hellenicus (strain DSM 12710 / JCM 10830 / BK20S6-10-b1 / P8) TaxID=591019 RepID=D7D819_STAHD|nr:ABC transporter permease [Staphylothermus hellenicus]ADI31915.1 binding-protein-dependent transport systems inner membrane component [Staphylothermus hellenicus DSM 12710]
MGLVQYIVKRIIIYTMVFLIAVSIVWLVPRLLGNPLATVIARVGAFGGAGQAGATVASSYFMQAFGFNKPLHEQYLLFLRGIFSGDFGISLWLLGRPVSSIVYRALIFDILLMVPAIIISWFIGNYLGALAAMYRRLDKILMPIFYVLSSTPYFILAMLLQWALTVKYNYFPTVIQSSVVNSLLDNPSWDSFLGFLHALTLPLLSLVLVSMGGWASGIRTMIIYEMESDYSKYMESLGMSIKKITMYAFRHAINPQISGLGVQLGTLVVGSIVIEYIFNYPGLGFFLNNAIINNDPFLLEGSILLLTIMVIAANFIIDMLYVILDPRIRLGVRS